MEAIIEEKLRLSGSMVSKKVLGRVSFGVDFGIELEIENPENQRMDMNIFKGAKIFSAFNLGTSRIKNSAH